MFPKGLPVFITVAFLFLVGLIIWLWPEDQVEFSTEVKPILNKHCISCHGGVKKNGGFSVLFEEEALAPTESGIPAIIPGRPNQSTLIKRLHETDPELRMPYQKPPLSEEEIEILRKWIKQGAKWGEHWAYKKVAKPQIPAPPQWKEGIKASTLDAFVLEKLEENGLQPSAPESKGRLLRRLSMDITGLPPSEGLTKEWKTGQVDLDQVVDRLLADPAFGEKWASWWLDLARYADTKGYERDVSRTMWPYRDWVIEALNADMPFDQFTIEQLAGDLLPQPSDTQLKATAFHRNTMNNDEGGTEDEEFRVAAVLDRVNTTFEVWQSTTMACVQCHSHPYDPIHHEEYFQVAAFFNNSRDEDTHDEEPKLRMYEASDLAEIEIIKNWVNDFGKKEDVRFYSDFLRFQEPKYHAHLCEDFDKAELIDTKWLGLWPGGSTYLRDVYTGRSDLLLLNYWADVDGTKMSIREDGPDGRVLSQFVINKTQGRLTRAIPFLPVGGKVDLYISAENPNAKAQQNTSAIVWFAFVPTLPGKEKTGHAGMQEKFISLLNQKPLTLPIMGENPNSMQRETRVFERGNWLLLGEKVEPKTPAVLNPWQEKWPKNRLGLAHWLTDKENPLTARTVVNRVWQQLFGRGLVNTLEDMGTQSDTPSHPELLDYLAWQLMYEYDWSLKKLISEIVRSHTYQQSSQITPAVLAADPENRWYARGPRIRLSAEQIRDQALASTGLLSRKMHGPPVMPEQPEGVWQTVYNGESWTTSEGEDMYRRAIYTLLKRTSPYPSFISFDAGSREVCLSKRIVTNTPLQALVTLNDPVYIDAAREMARKMYDLGEKPQEAITSMYGSMMLEEIPPAKLQALTKLYEQALENYRQNPEMAIELISQSGQNNTSKLAAYVVVANALLNLDEFLTKP
jgi:hypothetical protein